MIAYFLLYVNNKEIDERLIREIELKIDKRKNIKGFEKKE